MPLGLVPARSELPKSVHGPHRSSFPSRGGGRAEVLRLQLAVSAALTLAANPLQEKAIVGAGEGPIRFEVAVVLKGELPLLSNERRTPRRWRFTAGDSRTGDDPVQVG